MCQPRCQALGAAQGNFILIGIGGGDFSQQALGRGRICRIEIDSHAAQLGMLQRHDLAEAPQFSLNRIGSREAGGRPCAAPSC